MITPIEESFLQIPFSDCELVLRTVGTRWEALRGKKLVLTGGTGFVGKWLLATFLEANRRHGLAAEIVVVSRSPKTFLSIFPGLVECQDITWIEADVRGVQPHSLGPVDYIIHAATDVVGAASPFEVFDTCDLGTRAVLGLVERSQTSETKLLLLSSGAIYGRVSGRPLKIPEAWSGGPAPALAASAYGEGKRVSETLCALSAAENPSLCFSIARLFAFVGPHLPLDKHFAIGNFILSALRGEEVVVEGDGSPLRSYMYAADLAAWLWVMLFQASNGTVYNVGGDEAISIGDLARQVTAVLGGAGAVKIRQEPTANGGAVESYVPCTARIQNDLGVSQSVTLDEAILRTGQWAAVHEPRMRR